MVGDKFYLPKDKEAYKACAKWCNTTQQGKIVRRDDYYECVENVKTERKIGNTYLLKSAVYNYLATVAKKKDYDSVDSCLSYMYSDNATWRKDAEEMSAFRDKVWTKYYELLTDTLTVDELVSQLPT